jgi:glycoprotein endo-alpha-1,2-mannosidase
VLRRLLVVGLAWAFLGAPACARAATVSVFYYPWYGTPALDGGWQHWNQNTHAPPSDLYSRFYPARGPYSSSDPRVVADQMAQIRAAGIDEVVVSWWGRGSQEDLRLPLVVSWARRDGLLVGIHLEPYPGRSPQSVSADLQYLAGFGVRDVYVYHPRDFTAADWAPLNAAAPPTMRMLAGTDLIGFAAAAHFAGIYTYDFLMDSGGKLARLCAQAHLQRLVCLPSVGPGYDGRRAGESPLLRNRQRGATYDALWTAALAAAPDAVSVTSFNEWGEGTQIEPAASRRGYSSYDGAWGLSGLPAQGAYLARTGFWAAKAHAQSP